MKHGTLARAFRKVHVWVPVAPEHKVLWSMNMHHTKAESLEVVCKPPHLWALILKLWSFDAMILILLCCLTLWWYKLQVCCLYLIYVESNDVRPLAREGIYNYCSHACKYTNGWPEEKWGWKLTWRLNRDGNRMEMEMDTNILLHRTTPTFVMHRQTCTWLLKVH